MYLILLCTCTVQSLGILIILSHILFSGLLGGIPGNIATIFLVRRFGRKRVIIIAHIFVSVFAIHIPTVMVGEFELFNVHIATNSILRYKSGK